MAAILSVIKNVHVYIPKNVHAYILTLSPNQTELPHSHGGQPLLLFINLYEAGNQ
jgi:hypothetical protein